MIQVRTIPGALRAGLGALLVAAALTGCTTVQARDVTTSGFLGDYSTLREGTGDEALLVYRDESAPWSRYTKIQMDPVVVFANREHDDIPREDMQALVDYLDAAVRRELGGDYQFTHEAGPDVLRLRIAITEAEGSTVALDVMSTIVPVGRVLSELKQLATGTGAFTGSAGCEAEILDSTTGQRLAAAVDRRVGRKAVSGAFSKWDDVRECHDFWAVRLRERLAAWRAAR